MKKVLLAIAAVATITSCSQNEEFENPAQKAEINVGTVVKTTSRAAVTNNENFTAFKVTSFIVANDFNFSTTLLGGPYMDGVLYKGKKGSWKTDDINKYYWPTDKNVQFFGYPESCTLAKPTENGYPTLAFTIGEKSEKQTDLVVASENMSKSTATNNTVTLSFKHILTKINFSYKPDKGYDYTISEIKITGVKGKAAIYTYAANVTNGSWTGGEAESEGYVYTANPATTADANGYYTLDSDNNSLMLLPQTLSGAQISIKYVTTKGGATFFDDTKTIEIPANSEWKIGMSVRYKLTLPAGKDQIGLDTDVNEWTDTPIDPEETPSV